jgi:hypothetical protein
MKKSIVFFILLLCAFYGYPEKLAVFPEVLKADDFQIGSGRMFVTENTTIYIYNLKDFKFIKKFGKPGEGPQEFKINPPDYPLGIQILPDRIMVSSVGKVSFFSLDGKFIKENSVVNINSVQSLGKNFVGVTFINEGGVVYRTINLFGPQFNKLKEVYREKFLFQPGKSIDLLKKSFLFKTCPNRIFVSAQEGFVIDIFDGEGNLVNTIKREFEPQKVREETKKGIHKMIEKRNETLYPLIKDRIRIADYWPAIAELRINDQKLYVSANKFKGEEFEFYLFDLNGKLLKTFFLKLDKKNPIQAFPYDFHDGKIYQLIENWDTEEWELHVREIKK